MLSGNSEAGLLLCVPLIGGDGTVYGVCGFEVSAMQFKQSHSPDNSIYTRVFSALAPCEEKELLLDQGLLAGNTYLNSTPSGSDPMIGNESGGMTRYQTQEQKNYGGMHRVVSLYPADSPYQEYRWAAIVMAPEEDLELIAHEGALGLRIGIGLLCAFSLLMAALISRRYISPVLSTLAAIKS